MAAERSTHCGETMFMPAYQAVGYSEPLLTPYRVGSEVTSFGNVARVREAGRLLLWSEDRP